MRAVVPLPQNPYVVISRKAQTKVWFFERCRKKYCLKNICCYVRVLEERTDSLQWIIPIILSRDFYKDIFLIRTILIIYILLYKNCFLRSNRESNFLLCFTHSYYVSGSILLAGPLISTANRLKIKLSFMEGFFF